MPSGKEGPCRSAALLQHAYVSGLRDIKVPLCRSRDRSVSWGDNSLIKRTVPSSRDRASSNGQSLYSMQTALILEEQGRGMLDAWPFLHFTASVQLYAQLYICKVQTMLDWEVKESRLRQSLSLKITPPVSTQKGQRLSCLCNLQLFSWVWFA